MNLWNQRSCIFYFSVKPKITFYIHFLYQLVGRSAHLAIFSFQFPSPFHFLIPAFLPCFYFLTQADIITQFPHLYAITYFVLPGHKYEPNVTLIIVILYSFTMLTSMSMVSICNITVISFLTASLDYNQFTSEGKAKLQKAREERDPDCVELNLSVY